MMETLVTLLLVALAYCVYRLRIRSQEATIRDLVAWCATADSDACRANLSLWDYVWNAQLELNLPIRYRLTREERADANLILSAYQKDLSERYTAGHIRPDKAYSRLRGRDYFMRSLRDYLHTHECDLSLGGCEKYQLLSCKDYGSWGGRLYDAEYELTAFGRVYHKLMFVAELRSLGEPVSASYMEDHSVLDTNRIQISRM